MQDYKSKAQKLLTALNAEGIAKYNCTDEAMELVREYDAENGTFDIVDDDIINGIIKRDIDGYGWERVACFLAGAEINEPYGYRLDGYGNLRGISFDDITLYLEEIAEN